MTKIKVYLTVFVLLVSFLLAVGLLWIKTTPGQTMGSLLAFAAGLSMIILPCTFPLVFVIVPLSLGKGYKKGFLTALSFGIGLAITLSAYGIATAGLGKVLGLDKVTQIMFLVAGLSAFLFGLAEIKLLKLKLPSFGSGTPKGIQEKEGYLKSFLLGLFLGNAGVGCPNPAFYVLLTYIASTGNLLYGGWLGFIHGAGRAFPLILISILGILGINTLGWLTKKRVVLNKIVGWLLIIVGAFILIQGLPGGHQWYEETFIHNGWNKIVKSIGLPSEMEMKKHEHAETGYQEIIPWILLVLIAAPVVWVKLKNKKGC